ncbi:tectonin 1 [Gigaspora margarita]|uniref:Tectonin 1 n=1 Tax=Gigaspora margarita TaxID=4874 RepID=A0A8H4AK30_GIGMA|nr:tectonin 1 [Gigaspora margarita]
MGWQKIDGQLTQLAVGRGNNVWGVNSQNNIFRYINGTWQQISGAATYVGVGVDGTVWVVSRAGFNYKWVDYGW